MLNSGIICTALYYNDTSKGLRKDTNYKTLLVSLDIIDFMETAICFCSSAIRMSACRVLNFDTIHCFPFFFSRTHLENRLQ